MILNHDMVRKKLKKNLEIDQFIRYGFGFFWLNWVGLELIQYKNDSISPKKIQFWICRVFASPIRRGKKRGDFKHRIFVTDRSRSNIVSSLVIDNVQKISDVF